MQIRVVHARVKFAPIYKCAKCGASESGSYVTRNVDTDSFEHMANTLNALPLRSHDMPEGWQFNGEFSCKACRTSPNVTYKSTRK